MGVWTGAALTRQTTEDRLPASSDSVTHPYASVAGLSGSGMGIRYRRVPEGHSISFG